MIYVCMKTYRLYILLDLAYLPLFLVLNIGLAWYLCKQAKS